MQYYCKKSIIYLNKSANIVYYFPNFSNIFNYISFENKFSIELYL